MPDEAEGFASVRGELILLGTGTSVGVPMIGCACPVCRSEDPRNSRTRTSAVFGLPQGNLLVDTSPDLRTQMLRERIRLVHAVVYTHEHADHIFGMDDLRLLQFYLGGPVPVYATAVVEDRLRKSFDYAFASLEPTHAGATPQLEMRRFDEAPFSILGAIVQPIRLLHGPRFVVHGFRVGRVAYCTDVKTIPDESWPKLEGLDALVIDALRYRAHPTHMNLEEALAVVDRVRPRRTILVHTSHDLEYSTLSAQLPAGVEMGYDGMRIPLT
jgi:phosphoribosyl 1,2-cyclic phosphate phosphodiesterase